MFKYVYLFQLRIKRYLRLRNFDSIFGTIKLVMAVILLLVVLDRAIIRYGLVANADQFKQDGNYYYATMLYKAAEPYYSLMKFTPEHKKMFSEIKGKEGISCLRSGKTYDAETAMAYGLMDVEKSYGLKSYETAEFIRNYLIPYYIEKGDVDHAQRFANYALNIYKSSPKYINEIADILRLYGKSEVLAKNDYRAYELYVSSLRLIKGVSHVNYDIYLAIVDDTAQYYKSQNKPDELIALYAQTVDDIEKRDKNEKAPLAMAYRSLAKGYCAQEDYQKSVVFYEKSISIIKTMPKSSLLRKQLVSIMYELVDVYEKADLLAYASKMKQEAYKYQAKNFFTLW